MRVDRRPDSNVVVMPVAVKCCCPEQIPGYRIVNAGCKVHGWVSGVAHRGSEQPVAKVKG